MPSPGLPSVRRWCSSLGVVLLLALAAAGCGGGTDPTQAEGGDESSTTGGIHLGEAGTTVGASTSAGALAGDRSEDRNDPLSSSVPGAGDDRMTSPGGTDQARPEDLPPAGPTSALRADLLAFGEAYLSFDYRRPANDRVDTLAELTTAELAAELAVPLPAETSHQLQAEQRVVIAEFVSLEPVDTSVYQMTYIVSVTQADGAEVLLEPEQRALLVTVDANGLISDVL